jgi:hypothetical protein
MGNDVQGIHKRKHGILSPIVAEPRVKHEGLGFDGKNKKCHGHDDHICEG